MTETAAPPRRLDLGDFQTPDPLARQVCDLVARSGFPARSILEPTCGVGAFIVAAAQAFPRATRILGSDINAAHVAVARSRVQRLGAPPRVDLETADFFATDWQAVIGRLLRATSFGTTGSLSVNTIRSLHADVTFIGPDGVTLEGWVRTFSLDDAASARAMSESSSRTVVLASPAKIGSPARVRVIDWSQVDTLVAAPLPEEFTKSLRQRGVAILQAT